MAQTIETWRPPGDSRTLWQLLSGGGPTPEGDGWSITGYTPAQVAFGKGFQNVNVPTYQRVVGQAAAPAPAAAPPPAPAPQPTYQPKPAVPDNFQPTAPAPAPQADPYADVIKKLQEQLAQAMKPPDTSQYTKQIDALSQQLANQQASYAQQIQAAQQGYQSQVGQLQSQYDNQFRSMRDMYDQQVNALNMRIQDMNNANNQDSWRIRAAQQAGSASADSVQSGQYSPPAGTEKLNRSYQPYGSSGTSSNFLSNLLINPTLGGLSSNPLLIGGVNI